MVIHLPRVVDNMLMILKLMIQGGWRMDLAEAFRNYKDKIVDRWVDYTLSTYQSSSFFKKERDIFANPVGGNIREALKKLFSLLVKGAGTEEMIPPLEQILKIRSIQEFPHHRL